ncbi:MAG TPA: chemotaxis protein CheW [Bacteroidales bacterium]|nr:chemotaxis protein CheW [Bacteroidales bacterium]
MKPGQHYLAFLVDDYRLCIPIGCVNRVVYAAALKPAPKQPWAVLGILDLEGSLVPVLSCYQLLGLQPAPIHPQHRFIIVNCTSTGAPDGKDDVQLALHVSGIHGMLLHEQCRLEQLEVPDGAKQIRQSVLIDDTGNYWLFEPEQLLEGVDIALLEQIASAS